MHHGRWIHQGFEHDLKMQTCASFQYKFIFAALKIGMIILNALKRISGGIFFKSFLE